MSASPQDTLLVFITCPTATADDLAGALVELRLAACVNVLPAGRSVYRWQGAVERAEETLLIAKTSQARYAELEAEVRRRHPYELPEIVAVHLACGLPAYLQWVHDFDGMKTAALILAIGAALLSGMAAADGFWPKKDGASGSSHDLLKADQAFHLIAAEREGQTLKVSWDIAPGYYLYRKRLAFQALTPEGAQLGAAELPKGELIQDEHEGKAEIYRGSLQAALHWPQLAAPQRLRVSYQGCAEAGVCYPPQTRTIDVIDLSH